MNIQRCLLAEAKLMYKSAIDIAVGMEVALKKAQELQQSTDTTVSRDVNRNRGTGTRVL